MNLPSEGPEQHEDDHLAVELDQELLVEWLVTLQPCTVCGRIAVAAVCRRLAAAADPAFQAAVDYAMAAKRA